MARRSIPAIGEEGAEVKAKTVGAGMGDTIPREDEQMQSNELSYEELAGRLDRCLRELDHYKSELTREIMLHAVTKWQLKEAKRELALQSERKEPHE